MSNVKEYSALISSYVDAKYKARFNDSTTIAIEEELSFVRHSEEMGDLAICIIEELDRRLEDLRCEHRKLPGRAKLENWINSNILRITWCVKKRISRQRQTERLTFRPTMDSFCVCVDDENEHQQVSMDDFLVLEIDDDTRLMISIIKKVAERHDANITSISCKQFTKVCKKSKSHAYRILDNLRKIVAVANKE